MKRTAGPDAVSVTSGMGVLSAGLADFSLEVEPTVTHTARHVVAALNDTKAFSAGCKERLLYTGFQN